MAFSPARFYQWGAIGLVLVIGAGLYWQHQGKAAEKINTSKTEVMPVTATGTLVGYWTLDGNNIVWGDANEIKDVNPGTKHDGNVAGSLAAGSVRPGITGQGILPPNFSAHIKFACQSLRPELFTPLTQV